MPIEPLILSKMALERISGKDSQLWEVMLTEPDLPEQTSFVIAACGKCQRQLLESMDELDCGILHVGGPQRIWLQKQLLFYYTLRLIKDKKIPEGDSQ